MKLSELHSSSTYVICPNCGNKTIAPVEGNSAKCPGCHFTFAFDKRATASITADGLTPPYIQFSMRYGGPFAARSDGITTAQSSRISENTG